jgi:OOP family OmpA-OmpF porin
VARERDVPVVPVNRWQELRTLLLGPERERLRRVEDKVNNPWVHAEEVSQVLPEAVTRRSAQDGELGRALGPILGDAIKTSVRRDPQPLVDAIFPIIGPAIRRAIASAFSELVQSVNATMEHSLTPRGLRWRMEAWRTGRSFGEVVLSHSLVFRVEQLFLVHRETGLLISHHTAAGVRAQSPDMVSGMLTAITDFVRDSFQVERQQELDSLALGDLTVWIEHGPKATLAAAIRGQAPVALRETMQSALEGIHRYHAEDLDKFAQTGIAFEPRADLIEPCLQSQLARQTSTSAWRLALLAGVILLAVGWCAVPRAIAARRFNAYVGALRSEPGVVVGSTGRRDGRHVLSGLRDPLSRNPDELRAQYKVDTARTLEHWEPYVALRPEFVLRRATAVLTPPATVELGIRGDTLVARGTAARAWMDRARGLATTMPGVGAVDVSAVRDSAELALVERAAGISQFEVRYAPGAVFPMQASRPTVDSLAATLIALMADAAAHARAAVATVHASTDTVGTEFTNARLRTARSEALRGMLLTRGVSASNVAATPDSTLGQRVAIVRVTLRPLPP